MPSFVQFGENFLKALRDHVEESDCNICSKVYILKGKAYSAELEDILKIARKVPFRILGDVPGV
jgi:methyl coenzyme M reductase alpha subunit